MLPIIAFGGVLELGRESLSFDELANFMRKVADRAVFFILNTGVAGISTIFAKVADAWSWIVGTAMRESR